MKRAARYGIGLMSMVGFLFLQPQQNLTREVLLLSDDFSGKESAENYIIEKSNKNLIIKCAKMDNCNSIQKAG